MDDRLFRENMSDERMEEISVYCELFLDSPWYFLCAVRPDDMDSLPDADRELAAFSFQNAMEDFCGDGAACFAIGENAACYYLRGFDVPPSEEEQRQLAETIRGRLYKLRGVFRCPLSAAAALVDDRHRIASCTALLDGWLGPGRRRRGAAVLRRGAVRLPRGRRRGGAGAGGGGSGRPRPPHPHGQGIHPG